MVAPKMYNWKKIRLGECCRCKQISWTDQIPVLVHTTYWLEVILICRIRLFNPNSIAKKGTFAYFNPPPNTIRVKDKIAVSSHFQIQIRSFLMVGSGFFLFSRGPDQGKFRPDPQPWRNKNAGTLIVFYLHCTVNIYLHPRLPAPGVAWAQPPSPLTGEAQIKVFSSVQWIYFQVKVTYDI